MIVMRTMAVVGRNERQSIIDVDLAVLYHALVPELDQDLVHDPILDIVHALEPDLDLVHLGILIEEFLALRPNHLENHLVRQIIKITTIQ